MQYFESAESKAQRKGYEEFDYVGESDSRSDNGQS